MDTELIIVMAFLVVLSIEDIMWKEVHLVLLLAFLLSGCVYFGIVRQMNTDEFIGGMLVGGMVFLAASSGNDLGSADGITLAATGAFLGLRMNLALVIISAFLAGIGAVVEKVFFKGKGRNTLPLIPFIAAGEAILIRVNL